MWAEILHICSRKHIAWQYSKKIIVQEAAGESYTEETVDNTRETMVTVPFLCPYPGIKSCDDGILLENSGMLNLEMFERGDSNMEWKYLKETCFRDSFISKFILMMA